MNEITLSNDLGVLKFEIIQYKQQVGQSFWEIGRRLNYIKQHNLAHGHFGPWLEQVGINHSAANRLMKIAEELPNSATLQNLGLSTLALIASLPNEERNKVHKTVEGIEKLPEEMTVSELNQLKKAINASKEEIQIVEVAMNKQEEIDNLINELEEAKKQLVEMKREQEVLKKFKEENDELSNQFKQLQQDINVLSEKKESFVAEMQALKDFSKFKEELNVLLAKLAPLRFNERFDIINKHAMFVEEYLELINLVENWCRDMRSVIKNKNNNVLDGDFQEI